MSEKIGPKKLFTNMLEIVIYISPKMSFPSKYNNQRKKRCDTNFLAFENGKSWRKCFLDKNEGTVRIF